jgi:hypothetical protein
VCAAAETTHAKRPWQCSRRLALTSDECVPFTQCLEMVRRLVLVGVMVLVLRGSVSQLVIATAVCAVYLLLQMQVAPFKSLADNFLATGCSFALLIFFACCVMFKIATLTEVPDLRERMSIEQRSDVRICRSTPLALHLAPLALCTWHLPHCT